MKKYSLLIFSLLLLLYNTSVFAINEDSLKIEKLHRRVATLDSQVLALNEHKKNIVDTIDKTYTASLTTTQYILTSFLSIVSVLSIVFTLWNLFGLKGTYQLKDDIQNKLNELEQKKKHFDNEYKDFKQKIEEINNRIANVEEDNKILDRKVTILNLLEKIIEAYDKKEFKLALTYLDTALSVDDGTEILLNYKLKILKALHKDNETIDVYYKLLNCAYDKLDYLFQLCEILLLEDRVEDYENLVSSYSETFKEIIKYNKSSFKEKNIYVYYLYVKAIYYFKKEDEKNLLVFYKKLKEIEMKDNSLQVPHPSPFYPSNEILLSKLIKLDKFDDMSEKLRNTMKGFVEIITDKKV